MNDTSPLPTFTDDRQVDVAASVGDTEATQRWRGNFLASDRPAVRPDFAADEGAPREAEFLRVWPEESEWDQPRRASWWSWLFSGRALQGAVIANGGALIVLALLIAAPGIGSKAGLMTPALVLGLGLMFAAIAAVVSLDFRSTQLRLARRAVRLAAISGAVSYGALAIAFPLLLIAR